MISAKQARDIVMASQKRIEAMIVKLDAEIREAAANNETELVLCDPDTYCDLPHFRTFEATPLQNNLTAELKKYGYEVNIVGEELPKGRGLGGGLADGMQDKIRWSLKISW